jgi:hypothetical protein
LGDSIVVFGRFASVCKFGTDRSSGLESGWKTRSNSRASSDEGSPAVRLVTWNTPTLGPYQDQPHSAVNEDDLLPRPIGPSRTTRLSPERPHGCVDTVVRGRECNRVAGAAVGAVGEGIAEAPGGGSTDFFEASAADGEIRWNQTEALIPLCAGDDSKCIVAGRLDHFFGGESVDSGGCGRFGFNCRK